MTCAYTLVPHVTGAIEPPVDGTLTRTIQNDDHLKAVVFAFSAGQELSEHTASTPAVMHFLSGEADVMLGTEWVAAQGETWIHMPARMPHSVRAKTAVVMLLLLLKTPPVAVSL